jgi:hypothetical protein
MFNVGCLEPPIDYGPQGAPWFLRATVAKRVHGKLRTSVHCITQQGDEDGEQRATTLHLDSLAIDADKDRQKFAKACVGKDPAIPQGDIEQALVELLLLIEVHVRQQEAYVPTTDEAANPYTEEDGSIVWRKSTREGMESVILTNFTARIASDFLIDDGVETSRLFGIEATLNGQSQAFEVPASKFDKMEWVTEHLGAEAVIEPGFSIRDRARVAIKKLSTGVVKRQAYAHLGWRHHEGKWVYLHGGGAIGSDGPVFDNIEVLLPEKLKRYALPEPPTERAAAEALRASLRMLEVAPSYIAFPIYSSIWLAVLGYGALTVFTAGKTGQFKSALQALALQHFGAEMDSAHLPENWESTANEIEGLCFQAKDALLVIDEFTPNNPGQAQSMQRTAERVIRAQANRSARGRMRADTSLRAPKPPRGMLLANGEDIPRGQSLRARMVIGEIPVGAVERKKLSLCQGDAAAGMYAEALAAFIAWLAPKYGAIHQGLMGELVELRQQAFQSGHQRTAENMARLALGWRYLLRFACDLGVFTQQEHDDKWREVWTVLTQAAAAQEQLQLQGDQARRFVELLNGAVASGHAHLANMDGKAPRDPRQWGWVSSEDEIPNRADNDKPWKPQGDCVGYVDEESDVVYLLPDAAYRVAQSLGKGADDALIVTPQTLHKRLSEDGYLGPREDSRPDRILTRQTLAARRMSVLPLKKVFLIGSLVCENSDQPDQPDQGQYPQGVPRPEKPDQPKNRTNGKYLNNEDFDTIGPVGPVSTKVETYKEKPFLQGGKQTAGKPDPEFDEGAI